MYEISEKFSGAYSNSVPGKSHQLEIKHSSTTNQKVLNRADTADRFQRNELRLLGRLLIAQTLLRNYEQVANKTEQ